MTREKKQEFTLRITQANKTGLIEILYEMILHYLDEGKEAYAQQDRQKFRDANRKARGCVNELLHSLNLEYELAVRLLQLYVYCNRELAFADVKYEPVHLDNVGMVIGKLQETYAELVKQDDSPPVMENPQAVYAGLTYGKKQLTENMADQGVNRGFRI